jgi:outer membrane immunogenic protein
MFDWSVAMRRFWLMAVMFAGVSSAHAADLPILRGGFTDVGPRAVNWQGVYAGVQGGYGASDVGFDKWTNSEAAQLASGYLAPSEMGLSGWYPAFTKQNTHTGLWGAFAGYNVQYEDVVLGVEGSYAHGNFGASQTQGFSGVTGGRLSDGYYHAIAASELSSISISDMATFRARAAYAWGCFLPYMFGGFALGNADLTQSAYIQDSFGPTQQGPFTNFVPLSATDATHNHLIYGYTAGLGVDMQLTGGLFMRAEWEYVRFTSAIDVNINTVRAGLGYKF